MKNAAVDTTTARGAAVNSSRMTAVQSVYIAQTPNLRHHLSRGSLISSLSPVIKPVSIGSLALAGLVLALCSLGPASAGVEFENCQPTADGGISCDTRPTGNTLMDDQTVRYGLFNDASPGWSEFDPDEGFEDDLGGNET
jgi:hypothetical protein